MIELFVFLYLLKYITNLFIRANEALELGKLQYIIHWTIISRKVEK